MLRCLLILWVPIRGNRNIFSSSHVISVKISSARHFEKDNVREALHGLVDDLDKEDVREILHDVLDDVYSKSKTNTDIEGKDDFH